MKKIIYLFIYILSAVMLLSCEEDPLIYDGEPLATFPSESGEYFIREDNNAYRLPVFLLSKASSDVTVSLEIQSEGSTAVEGTDFIIENKTIAIPAGELSADFIVNADFEEAAFEGKTVVFNVTSTDVELASFRTTFQLTIIKSCPSDLGGNYAVVSSGESTDGAPVNNPLVDFAYNVVITDNGDGKYTISDGVAGVYQEWYCAPYGYCFETAGNFTDICGNLSGSWEDAFGSGVILTGTDNGDGTLSIRWENGFGDYADAVYTKQ